MNSPILGYKWRKERLGNAQGVRNWGRSGPTVPVLIGMIDESRTADRPGIPENVHLTGMVYYQPRIIKG